MCASHHPAPAVTTTEAPLVHVDIFDDEDADNEDPTNL